MSSTEIADTLRIGIIKDNQLVEERILHLRRSVIFGKNPFKKYIVPGELGEYPLFEYVRDGVYRLNFTDGMEGEISHGRSSSVTQTLRDLRIRGAVKKRW